MSSVGSNGLVCHRQDSEVGNYCETVCWFWSFYVGLIDSKKNILQGCNTTFYTSLTL